MELSLIQAAKETGRSKSTIHRAIKSGKLSATRHEDGSYSIDPAELFRAYPKEPVAMTQEGTPIGTGGTNTGDGTEGLRVKVEMLTQQLEREQDTVADLRRRLDKAEDRLLALTASPAQAQKEVPRGGIWEALRGMFGGKRG